MAAQIALPDPQHVYWPPEVSNIQGHLPRTLLRGAGATLALPWLETMAPAADTAGSNNLSEPPLRMAFMFIPNGTRPDHWTPPG